MAEQFASQVYTYVSKIPAGRVMTYGGIAKALGRPNAARAVGNILKRNPNPFYKVKTQSIKTRRQLAVPCHRVVRADLKLGGYNGGVDQKRNLLTQEGVVVTNNRVAPAHVQNPLG